MSRRIKPREIFVHFSDGKFANLDGPPKKRLWSDAVFLNLEVQR